MGLLLRQCFSSEQEAFYLDLRPKYIMTKLVRDGLISFAERDEILTKDERKHQVQHLIAILSQKNGPKVFDSFLAALKENEAYPWLADKLLEKKKKLGYDNGKDLSRNLPYQLAIGGVPSQTNFLFERKDLLNQIRGSLKEASGQRRWIVLHGMIACGKSVLAAEAIRDACLFEQYFSAGVCWIPVGKLKTDNAIFFRLQILWEKLNPNQNFPWANLELFSSKSDEIRKATKALKSAFSALKNKDILLILDDVWERSVIQAFDIGCTTLVTTTNKGVVDAVQSFCSCVPFSDGLSLEESREFLALHVNAAPNDLPIEADHIFYKCKGLPMALSLIGGNLSLYGNREDRWRYWSRKLEKGIAAAFERKRNASGQLEYLNNTMKLIIDVLPPDLKDYYFDFAIFEEDIFVPNRVLEILWNLDKFDVEDTMQELYKRSLICIEEDHDQNCFMYSIHDVYLKFLKDECDKEKLKERHKKLVHEYLKLCENKDGILDYGLLPNDGYIYNFIGHHLYQADEIELFPKLFLDLNFLQNKLRFSAPWDLLYDFETYKDSFLNDFEEKEDMIAFIRRNAHLICGNDSDIKQLALFEPSDKSVYKKAKEMIIARPDIYHTYYELCNQENVPYWSQLSVKMFEQFCDLAVATFSPDNNLVAAVGDSKIAVIWESTSGKILERLVGHTDIINCCAFSSTGSLLATASNDKTVKIWHINHFIASSKRSSKGTIHIPISFSAEEPNLKDTKTFTLHEGEVLWCSFNPDDSLMVSSDGIGTVYIWESETKKLIWKFCHGGGSTSNQVHRCYFSSQSSCIATAAAEEIKLWNWSTETYENILNHEVYVTEFCFSSDAKFIYSASGSSIWKWNLHSACKEELFQSNRQSLFCSFCLSPNGQFIAAGTSNYSVIIWNVNTKKTIANLKGHKSSVKIVQYSHNGTKILSASEDGYSTIWDMNECMATSMVSLENNLSVRLTDDLIIASSDQLNRIQVRTGISGILKYKSVSDQFDITACSLSYDGSEVIYGMKNGCIKVFKLQSNETVEYFYHEGKVTYLMHMKNSGFISCSEDTTLKVWSIGGIFTSLKGHSGSVVMCVPFNNESKILSCAEDGRLIVWDTNLAEAIMKLEGHGNQNVNFCDVSSDEKCFCSASSDCTIKLWDANHGHILNILKCDDCVRCCRFCPLSQCIVSGEDSGDVKIWKYSKKWIEKLSLGFVDGWVKDIQFSEDGSQLLAVGESIKLFKETDLNYSVAQTFILPGAFTYALWASPDFKILVFVHNAILYILKTVL